MNYYSVLKTILDDIPMLLNEMSESHYNNFVLITDRIDGGCPCRMTFRHWRFSLRDPNVNLRVPPHTCKTSLLGMYDTLHDQNKSRRDLNR